MTNFNSVARIDKGQYLYQKEGLLDLILQDPLVAPYAEQTLQELVAAYPEYEQAQVNENVVSTF